jgi:hypothetical protein
LTALTVVNIVRSVSTTTRPANDAPATRYLSTAEKAAIIRSELKAQLGLNARQVSVRISDYSGGSSIYVTVKAAVGLAKVRAIASRFESIDRCESTGEILGGCNTYLHVQHSADATAGLREACEAELTAAAEQKRFARWAGFRACVADRDMWRIDFDGDDDSVCRPQAVAYGIYRVAQRMVEEFLDRRAVADAEMAKAVA